MMRRLRGTGVSSGIAIGRIHVLAAKHDEIQRYVVEDADAEIARFQRAQDRALQQLKQLRDKAAKDFGEGKAELFDTHQLMLRDPDYLESVEGLISSSKVNAEYAVHSTAEQFAAMFRAMDSSYMQARAADVRDVSSRVIDILQAPAEADGQQEADAQPQGEPYILAAQDLDPSETVQLDRSKVLAFVTAEGSANSHTSILARSMGLPAIVGIGDGLNEDFDGVCAIVDGSQGELLLDPDAETLHEYQSSQQRIEEHRRLLQELKGKPTVSSSGQRIRLYANIANPEEVDSVLANDAEGIGLFRSEFLYLESEDFPTEEFQFNAYRQVAQKMGDRLIVIRTLDIGADKQVAYFGLDREDNPALGYRAIRICLTQPEIFKVQLRALLRASAFGNIAIMLPMITSVDEVRRSKAIIEEVKAELRAQDIEFNEGIQLGIMVETPASVVMAPELAKEVDFFSIGTNDLTQYTLACDRQNQKLHQFADPHSPAVLRMIEMTVTAAHKAGIWCGICGELGADLTLTDTYLRIGVDELSVSAPMILPLRGAIRGR
ncbi:phosphoenolpyruvate--protein phosphotransferase [Bifidobacterium crudilactis]|jgi:phosphotransferase system enzyme I (PtsI)|uniref:phosphoenolpyruvate--protein phosphotransferase n=1 Tax=Bifidobacterium crudilactis TaxID=327277 RepID=UPI0023557B6F|nr:phosphoenolpyruvate--protein phosphotransferase [Bifidobacterium crudilactis]MCI1218286.1 phosphoenolpyruvate--protein phosphotransferase [Bifidobacterium crudilactis]